ncbi:hypothetical protein [Herbaspirillum sp. NPDC087042]|uniref:hypothetical protein n=1 Tax=Herbaspirillum sp. NPDC087042 TaxID=3364004 RepID=UPI00380828AD
MSHLPKHMYHLPTRHVIEAPASLHVVLRTRQEGGRSGQWGDCQVLCEQRADRHGQPQAAMVVYLSPFDACFDAAWCGLSAEQYQVVPATGFEPRELLGSGTGPLHYCLHLAWGARDGALAVRRQGALVRLSLARQALVWPGIESVHLQLVQDELTSYQRLWEGAGLFAHAESLSAILACSDRQRAAHASRAIDRIPATVAAGEDVNQVALYDVEAAQWHFVALGGVGGKQGDRVGRDWHSNF